MLLDYWKEFPPAHISLARIYHQLNAVFFDGAAPTGAAPRQEGKKEGNLEDLLAMFKDGVIRGG